MYWSGCTPRSASAAAEAATAAAAVGAEAVAVNNNRIVDVDTWMEMNEVVGDETKIGAFVESKDRLITATAASRLDSHEELLGRLPEYHARLRAVASTVNDVAEKASTRAPGRYGGVPARTGCRGRLWRG